MCVKQVFIRLCIKTNTAVNRVVVRYHSRKMRTEMKFTIIAFQNVLVVWIIYI